MPSVPNDNFVAVVEGPVNIVKEGAYKFCVISDDGYTAISIFFLFWVPDSHFRTRRSRMFIDGKQILSNPGVHGPTEKCVTVEVAKVAIFS